MGLFDAITGSASKKAARQNQMAIQNAMASGTASLNSGADKAIGLLGVGNGGTALTELGKGFTQARADVNAGYDAAAPALGKLGTIYDDMAAGGKAAFDTYLDGIGANGAEGNARAASAFTLAPGRQYAMDQALESVQRTAAARGGLAGGNTTADILKTATGYADQGFQSWLDNLKSGAGFYTTGTAGQASGATTAANAAIGRGTALGNLGVMQGTGAASLYGQGATTQSRLGQDLANLQLGGASALVSNNNALAKSQTEASGNFLGGLFGLGTSFLGNAGSNGGISNYLGGIFK